MRLLCLFPPPSAILHEALYDLKLQNLNILKGTVIQITAPMLHCDVDVWGPDAEVFNPTRFANGILGACEYPHMYIPFGFRPRTCVGQILAMVQVLMRFKFDLSPSYVHSPAIKLAVEPEHDLPLILKNI
jgi:cytochrome P450